MSTEAVRLSKIGGSRNYIVGEDIQGGERRQYDAGFDNITNGSGKPKRKDDGG
jgi:hypothetical protein